MDETRGGTDNLIPSKGTVGERGKGGTGGTPKDTSTTRPTERDGDTSQRETAVQSQGLPGSVSVNLPGGGEVQPVKVTKPKSHKKKPAAKTGPSTEGLKELQKTLEGLLLAGTAILATQAGPHWAFQTEEAKGIANPLGSILNRKFGAEKLNEYSDGIALVVAVSLAVVPRMIDTMEIRRSGKGVPESGTVKQMPKADIGGGEPGEGTPKSKNASNDVYAPSRLKTSINAISG